MDWEDIKTFSVVAETGTVRTAAARLGVHHATVGRRIARLETAMGTRLFDRLPTGLSLTTAGEEMLAVSRRVSNELDAVERRISGRDSALRGKVVATMGDIVATLLIAPNLPDFVERYPDIDLQIITTWSVANISSGEADIAIRADNNPTETLVGKRLFPYTEAIYASSSYLDTYRSGATGRWIGWGSNGPARPSWVEKTEFAGTEIWGHFENIGLQVAAARAGLGFIALPCIIGDQTNGLVRASDTPPRPARDLWILTHSDLRRTRRVRVVMEFFEQCLRRKQAVIQGTV